VLLGCGDDDPGAADRTTPTTSAAGPTTTHDVPSTTSSTAVDVCTLLNPETVGSVLGEQVTPEPDPDGGCSYEGASATSRRPFIAVVPTGDEDDARTAAEQRLGATATDLALGGGTGWIVSGSEAGSPGVEAGATAKGSTISLTMGGTQPDADREVAQALLNHVIDALG
jgi:hypothetical protein